MFSEHVQNHAVFAVFGASGASLGIGIGLLLLRRPLSRLTKTRDDHLAVQASHSNDCLRLGGVAITLGILLGAASLAGHSHGTFTLLLLASLVPVFAAGLWEDLGRGVSAGGRFFASTLAAVIAVLLLGHWVNRGDLFLLDAVMGFVPAGVIFTILLAALYSHAVNLIDGMNGLAAIVVISSAIGLSFVAAQVELYQVSALASLIASATFGFLVLNWPVSRLFLGDAGAYGLGHLLVWMGISLIALAPNVAVPSVILILFYPFVDTLHTILRRLLEHEKLTEPDRMHLHQKIRRGLEMVWLGRHRRQISNPLTTLVMVPLVAGPVMTGALLWNQPGAAWFALSIYGFAFVGLHLLITAMAKRHRKHAVIDEDEPTGQASLLPFNL